MSNILTPFTRTIGENGYNNYTPYQLFCLKSRLMPYLIQKYGDVSAQFISVYEDPGSTLSGSFTTLSVHITRNSDPIPLSENNRKEIQTWVNYIAGSTPFYALILDYKIPLYIKGKLIDSLWLKSILPYLIIPDDINPFIENGKLHGTFAHLDDYNLGYNTLLDDLINQIEDMYLGGYIVSAESIAIDWELVPVSDDGKLYKPNWSDWNIPDMVRFLERKILEEQELIYHQDRYAILNTNNKSMDTTVRSMLEYPEKLFKINSLKKEIYVG